MFIQPRFQMVRGLSGSALAYPIKRAALWRLARAWAPADRPGPEYRIPTLQIRWPRQLAPTGAPLSSPRTRVRVSAIWLAGRNFPAPRLFEDSNDERKEEVGYKRRPNAPMPPPHQTS